jgi:catechol-2,3-dioxygenase
MSQITGIAEIVLAVHSMPESLKFYSDMLGLPTMSPVASSGPVFLKVAETAGVPQMLVLVPLPKDAPSFTAPRTLHHLALEIAPEQFDAEQFRLESLGFKVRGGKHPVIVSRTMYINDPDGNEVELICTA